MTNGGGKTSETNHEISAGILGPILHLANYHTETTITIASYGLKLICYSIQIVNRNIMGFERAPAIGSLCSVEEYMNPCLRFPHKPRRRQVSIAVITATALAAASVCSAFSYNRLPCHSGVQSSSVLDYSPNDNEYTPRRTSRHGLKMVSFLESELMTREKIKSNSRARNGHGKGCRNIELNREPPDDGAFDFDFFITESTTTAGRSKKARPRKSRERRDSISFARASLKNTHVQESQAPQIDSVVLYSSITKAHAPKQDAEVKPEAKLDLSKNSTVIAIPTEGSLQDTTMASKPTLQQTFQAKSKSSTMPGFITPKGLDEYITSKATTRMSSTKRKVSQMSRKATMKRRQLNSEALYKKSSSVPDSLLSYTKEIHAISRVSPKEEIELGTKTQEAIRLQKMYNDLHQKYGREPTDDEWCAAAGKINMEALKEALQAGNDAKNQLVASNLRMVQRVVNLYIRNGLGSEYNAGDLMQDGTMVRLIIDFSSLFEL